jgi:hypothetical protein
MYNIFYRVYTNKFKGKQYKDNDNNSRIASTVKVMSATNLVTAFIVH